VSKIWFTADPHFGHKNIIKLENRPFDSIKIMDDFMIKNWNDRISKNDTVFIAGDFSFHNKLKTSEIISQLNGNKILVRGNHDTFSSSWYIDAGFKEVSSYPVIVNDWFIVSHEPPHYFNESMPFFYIYGHVHSTPLYKTVTKQSTCVCVERWNYIPLSMEVMIANAMTYKGRIVSAEIKTKW
jgi:calcineurin-like phosphoesterase family protein